jgi:hypothetical protein
MMQNIRERVLLQLFVFLLGFGVCRNGLGRIVLTREGTAFPNTDTFRSIYVVLVIVRAAR